MGVLIAILVPEFFILIILYRALGQGVFQIPPHHNSTAEWSVMVILMLLINFLNDRILNNEDDERRFKKLFDSWSYKKHITFLGCLFTFWISLLIGAIIAVT